MPQHSMIPRDRDDDPVLDSSEELDSADDDDFLDDLNIVLAED